MSEAREPAAWRSAEGEVPHRADLRGHPVADLLLRRIAEGSRPGERRDPHTLALAIEGGGMRGVVSAGMVAALDGLGARLAFDLVAGVSAGASNGFALLAGRDLRVASAYADDCTDGRFLSVRRALARRGPVMDLEHLVDDIVIGPGEEGVAEALGCGVRLGFLATRVDDAAPVMLSDFADVDELRTALRASSLIPGVAGPPVELRGSRWVDGTVAESIPFPAAVRAGATHVLVLQTRPVDVPLRAPSLPERLLVGRALRRLGPELVQAYEARPERYAHAVAELAERSADGAGPPFLATVRPAAGTPPVGHLEQDRATLRAGARSGFAALHVALTGREADPDDAREVPAA